MADDRKVVFNSHQLRDGVEIDKTQLQKNEIYLILDNVLDTYNIGSIFRLADAVAAKKVLLCGGSEIPPNPRIKKASIKALSTNVIRIINSSKIRGDF